MIKLIYESCLFTPLPKKSLYVRERIVEQNNNYFYITFKHYNIKPKKQINKKEHYCTHKVRAMNLVLLIRGFSCFVFNFWRTKISSYKF